MQWYYVTDAGENLPADDAQLSALAQAGKISRQTFLWKEGMGDWAPAEQVFPALFTGQQQAGVKPMLQGGGGVQAGKLTVAPGGVGARATGGGVAKLSAKPAAGGGLSAPKQQMQAASSPAAVKSAALSVGADAGALAKLAKPKVNAGLTETAGADVLSQLVKPSAKPAEAAPAEAAPAEAAPAEAAPAEAAAGPAKARGAKISSPGASRGAAAKDSNRVLQRVSAPLLQSKGTMKLLGILLIVSGLPLLVVGIGLFMLLAGFALCKAASLYEQGSMQTNAEMLTEAGIKLGKGLKSLFLCVLLSILAVVGLGGYAWSTGKLGALQTVFEQASEGAGIDAGPKLKNPYSDSEGKSFGGGQEANPF